MTQDLGMILRSLRAHKTRKGKMPGGRYRALRPIGRTEGLFNSCVEIVDTHAPAGSAPLCRVNDMASARRIAEALNRAT